jgi:hypothetical protein
MAYTIDYRVQHKIGTGAVMRSILLYFLGIPLPIILLLAFCTHHF